MDALSPKGKRRYFPIIAILAAVATLILLLVIYTSRNLTLARERLEDSLRQEGLTLIRAIEAGNRTGLRMRWALNQLQTLVEEIAKDPHVAYISVIGADGKILAHSQPEAIGQTVGVTPRSSAKETAYAARTVRSDAGVDVFEITAHIPPAAAANHGQAHSGMGTGSGQGLRRGMGPLPLDFPDVAVIQLGMHMSEWEQIENRDKRNAVLMLVVLSVVGSAALYFIVFSQNYYAVNQAFRTMQSYTQHVVDSMANGLISLDTQGNIVTLNRQARHILALPPNASVQGKALTDALTIHEAALLQNLAKGEPVIERELRCTNAAQHTLPLSLSASTLTDDDGQQLGTVLLFRDLSEVKALQEQIKRAERLAAIGQLAAGIAHEIRNPLGALKGFLQYFQRKLELQEQDRTYLAVMLNEVDRLNTVISNLLDFARPKDPVLEPCDLAELIRHVLTLLAGDLQAKQLQVENALTAPLPPMRLDCDQITQVLLNILLNAIQATAPQGQIKISVYWQTDANRVELAISDTGKGIAPADVPKIFDPFFSTKKQGAGLGLAIAYTIIENHHGDITVESTEGQGSAFRIRLPAA